MDPISRRTFLQTSALFSAATYLGHDNRVWGANDRLNVALIGAGGQGNRVLSKCLMNSGVELVALCEILDPHFEATKKATGKNPNRYDDWNVMFDKEDLDAVLIALPEHTHHPAAVAAMKAGCHVFCEKPMAYSIEQGHDMIRVSRETGKVLQIGQQRRSNPLYYFAAELLADPKTVGQFIRVDAFWDRWQDWTRPLPKTDQDFTRWGFPSLNHLINWRLYREYGHGLMTENGTHQMDASGWLTGNRRPRTVCGIGATLYADGRETHDVCTANYLYDGDLIVRFSQDFHQGLNYGWNYGELFLGDQGALRITEERQVVHYPKGDSQGKPQDPATMNKGNGFEISGVAATAEQLADIKDFREFSYEAELRAFVHCCRTGATPPCTGQIGHNSIVPTIVGTDAQFSNRVIEFRSEWWA